MFQIYPYEETYSSLEEVFEEISYRCPEKLKRVRELGDSTSTTEYRLSMIRIKGDPESEIFLEFEYHPIRVEIDGTEYDGELFDILNLGLRGVPKDFIKLRNLKGILIPHEMKISILIRRLDNEEVERQGVERGQEDPQRSQE